MSGAAHIQQLRQQAHQALAAALPQWPANLADAQAHAGCRMALATVVTALLALQPAYPKHPAGAGAPGAARGGHTALMRLPLRPLPAVDRRRAAAGDTDAEPSTEGSAA